MSGIFRNRPRQPGLLPPKQATFAVVVTDAVSGAPIAGAGVILSLGQEGQTNADGYFAFVVPQGRAFSWSVNHAPGHEEASGAVQGLVGNLQLPVALTPVAPPVVVPTARQGLVRAASGRGYQDDTGRFYPLGATLFWAVRGWKLDRARVRQNLAWLQRWRFDYVRILCEVGWPGNDIRPDWADYRSILRELVDACFDEYGLRVEPTLIGGGTGLDPAFVLGEVVAALSGRAAKVIHYEAANEAFQNLPDVALVRSLARMLQAATPNLVATSSPQNADNDEIRILMSGGVGNMATAHYPRPDGSQGEGAWHAVSQPWGGATIECPWSHNEPRGPASSVASDSDPLRLAMTRAIGILCGVGAYVLHNGSGVAGQVDAARGRTANLYEMPNIDAVMDAVRGVDTLLPVGMEGWQRTTQHGGTPVGPQPLTADAIWTDGGSDHGVYRNYGAVSGGEFVQMPIAVKKFVDLTAGRACDVVVYDPVTRAGSPHSLAQGEILRLDGRLDANAAYIIRGTFR